MKHKIDKLFQGWKEKGYKVPNHKKQIHEESKHFIEMHDKEVLAKELKKEHEKDLILGLEIKYLDWLRGIF